MLSMMQPGIDMAVGRIKIRVMQPFELWDLA